jgi:hypothetical protein
MSSPTQFLPDDSEDALVDLLKLVLSSVSVATVGEQDINDSDELVFRAKSVRVMFDDTQYSDTGDNQGLTYNAVHKFLIFCAGEDLRSKEAQRKASLALVRQVLNQVVGARLSLEDGSKSEPVYPTGTGKFMQEDLGTVYIVGIGVPGIAQFTGPNANQN